MARKQIEENHPLNATPFSRVFPLFRPVLGLCDKKDQVAVTGENQRLLDEENKLISPSQSGGRRKLPKLDKEQQEDPFNFLGFGMVAYRDLMFLLFCLLVVITLIMLPVISIYKNGTGLVVPMGYASMSLGNLGYSTTQCTRIPLDLGRIPLYCPYGNITNLKYLGINPEGTTDKDACSDDTQLDESKICLDAMDPNFKKNLQTTLSSSLTNDLVSKYTKNQIFLDEAATPASCKAPGAMLYVQFSCEQTSELLKEKFRNLSIVSSLSIFVACLFMIVIYNYKKGSKLQQLEWDMSTITPGDYTLQMEITTDLWQYFLQNVYHKNDMEAQGISSAYALKTYMKNEVEKILSETLLKHKQEHPDEMKNIKIS